MRGEPVELDCPFCGKGKIQAWYIPGAISIKRESTATFGSKQSKRRSSDIFLIQSGCNVCGKSKEEVEKELKRKNTI